MSVFQLNINNVINEKFLIVKIFKLMEKRGIINTKKDISETEGRKVFESKTF